MRLVIKLGVVKEVVREDEGKDTYFPDSKWQPCPPSRQWYHNAYLALVNHSKESDVFFVFSPAKRKAAAEPFIPLPPFTG